jgi:hypothetical protein
VQVCSLVHVCLSRLYTTGDLLPLYARVNGLQNFLQDKNSTATEVGLSSTLLLSCRLDCQPCVASCWVHALHPGW